MNKEYIYNQDYVVVNTDKGLEKREKINNIVKILETENNIEEIETKKEFEDNYSYKEIKENISIKNSKKFISFSLPISIIITIILVLFNIFPLSVLGILGLPLLTTITTQLISEILTSNQTEKMYNKIKIKRDEILHEELINQKEKLKELNNTTILDNSYDIGKIGKIKKCERSKLIDDLKMKLELITDYQLMKDDLIEFSKDHFTSIKLKDMGYSENEVDFIQMLMEQDIKEEKNQKTLKLTKK